MNVNFRIFTFRTNAQSSAELNLFMVRNPIRLFDKVCPYKVVKLNKLVLCEIYSVVDVLHFSSLHSPR